MNTIYYASVRHTLTGGGWSRFAAVGGFSLDTLEEARAALLDWFRALTCDVEGDADTLADLEAQVKQLTLQEVMVIDADVHGLAGLEHDRYEIVINPESF
jgi:O-succinylbenzoate synthase